MHSRAEVDILWILLQPRNHNSQIALPINDVKPQVATVTQSMIHSVSFANFAKLYCHVTVAFADIVLSIKEDNDSGEGKVSQ